MAIGERETYRRYDGNYSFEQKEILNPSKGLHFGTSRNPAITNEALLKELNKKGIFLVKKNSKAPIDTQEITRILLVDSREVCKAKSYEEGIMRMAIEASNQALEGEDRSKIDFVAGITSRAALFDPAEDKKDNFSHALAKKLGLVNAVFKDGDTYGGCSGTAQSINEVKKREQELYGKRILLVAAEYFSNFITDPFDRFIFSDKAVAAVFTYGKDLVVIDSLIEIDESNSHLIKLYSPPEFSDHYKVKAPHTDKGFEMEGPKVQKYIEKELPSIVNKTLDLNGLSIDQIKAVVTPQNNGRIIPHWERHFPGKIFNYASTGNAAAASSLLTFMKAYEQNLIGKDDLIAYTSIGLGMAKGCALIKLFSSHRDNVLKAA